MKRYKLTKERGMRCIATFISNNGNLNERRMKQRQLRAAVKELKAVADSETEDDQRRQWEASHMSNQEFAHV